MKLNNKKMLMKFVCYRSPDKKTPPLSIQNEDLLCNSHKGFLYDPQVPSDAWVKFVRKFGREKGVTWDKRTKS